ncbi:hypothetical protein H2200_004514 [Cladophialophora chaetospira]|uniref:DNA replication regulator SLD2 n=1 Tax=Cladophialophora chaetospira TaxID=386627 RepID=A0AA39CK90_9EURO|nr:hypothetical protein H2200_004514 [Cladophialophora chaetospira]
MDGSESLLDTPKKRSLQGQAEKVRVQLKEYERTFATEHNGRKPSRDEIKSSKDIAAKYQQYQIIRDVIAGKRGLEALKTPKRQQKQKKHERADSAISLTPRRVQKSSPLKSQAHPNDIDPYDPPSSSISPRVLPHAIGPTPRRDGTVLGIFDLLSHTGSQRSSQATPSSRKRKINALYGHESRDEQGQQEIAQTPSQKPRMSTDHADGNPSAGTPRSNMDTGKRNHPRTPASDGKKFMLNHFFATPSTVRFGGMIGANAEGGTPARSQTPLRDLVLGITSKQHKKGEAEAVANDATPPYLKRSFSFKDRLLSASGDAKPNSTAGRRSLNGSSVQARFAPKPLSQIIADRQQEADEEKEHPPEQRSEEEDEDELDALREMEANQINILVEDSQIMDESGQTIDNTKADGEEQPVRSWKKKGQKRSTRRVIMRPVKTQPAARRLPTQKPRTHADDERHEEEEADEDDNNVSHVSETQLPGTPEATPDTSVPDLDDLDIEYLDDGGLPSDLEGNDHDGEDEFLPEEDQPVKPKGRSRAKATASARKAKANVTSQEVDKPLGRAPKSKKPAEDTDEGEVPGRKINPNAVSHMNFRSLKIKNKNSKAKGRGRFGKGRR